MVVHPSFNPRRKTSEIQCEMQLAEVKTSEIQCEMQLADVGQCTTMQQQSRHPTNSSSSYKIPATPEAAEAQTMEWGELSHIDRWKWRR